MNTRPALAIAAGIILAVFFTAGLLAPVLAPYDLEAMDLTARLLMPFESAAHILGTDELGRDIFSRSAYTEGYACALEGLGLPTVSIALRHILPNIASALVVNMTLNFPGMILLETSLSFLGVGVQPPMSSLGTMLGFGRDYLTTAWWIAVIPGLVIVVSTLSMSILGDWVQQKLEPSAQ